MATTTNSTTYVVKKVKQGKGLLGKSFYMEVGRLILRKTDKGDVGTLYLHHLDGDFVVYPAEKKDKGEAGGAEE